MRIVAINDLDKLDTVRQSWEVWQSHPNSDYAHFRIVCQTRPEVLYPYVCAVEAESGIASLLVARMEKLNVRSLIGYVSPLTISARVLSVVYNGILGDVNSISVERLIAHIWTLLVSKQVDLVEFSNLIEGSIILKKLSETCPRGWLGVVGRPNVHWTMDLPKTYEAFLAGIRSKHRSWFRKKERELELAFPSEVQWQWFTMFDNMQQLCSDIETVASRTYQRGLGAGFHFTNEHFNRLCNFAKRGLLRVQTLQIEGRTQAFWIGVLYKNTFYSWETGYNPELRQYEPGTLLFLRMVSELICEGIGRLDFGFGDAFYKERFGSHKWNEVTFRLFAPTFKGLLLRSYFGIADFLDTSGRQFLQGLGVLNFFKTTWRRYLSH